MAGAVAASVFFGFVLIMLVVAGVALTRKRHREGRSMWERTDAPWYFLKRTKR